MLFISGRYINIYKLNESLKYNKSLKILSLGCLNIKNINKYNLDKRIYMFDINE